MILELKRDVERKVVTFQIRAEKVLGESGGDGLVRRKLEVMSSSWHCGNRLREIPSGTQVAMKQLPLADANKSVEKGKLKLGWSVCLQTLHEPLKTCQVSGTST